MVKLCAITVHGDELLLGFAGPNRRLASRSTPWRLAAVALSDCDLLCITTNDVEQSPQLALAMMHAITARHSQVESLLALLGLRRVEERVRGFLELLAQDYGQPCDDGLSLNLPLTHQDIASALSTTRVTVTRVIGLLREEGCTCQFRRHIVIAHLRVVDMKKSRRAGFI